MSCETAWIEALCQPDVQPWLLAHQEALAELIPELRPTFGFEQHNVHHIYDVWMHTVVCVQAIEPEPVLRLAALFHDIGKPQCFTLDDRGVGHSHGHARVSADLAREILGRFQLDEALIDRVWLLIDRHDMEILPQAKYVRRAMLRLGSEAFFQLLQLKKADTLALNPAYFTRLSYLEQLKDLANSISL